MKYKIGRISNWRTRLAVTTGTVLVIAALISPIGSAAQPLGSSAGPGGADAAGRSSEAPAAPYNFQGDGFNSGTSQTWGETTYGASAACSWCFISTRNVAGEFPVALYGAAWGANTNGIGVRGQGLEDGVQGFVHGSTYISSGFVKAGVYGNSGSTGNGVYGTSTDTFSSGAAVRGNNTGTADYAYGVVGVAQASTGANSAGVRAYGPTGSNGYGVYSSGNTAVRGAASGTNGIGVYGTGTGAGYGVYGTIGGTGTGYGVVGRATNASGIALLGESQGGAGFYGDSQTGPGGTMWSNSAVGLYDYTNNTSSYAMVTGLSTAGHGNTLIRGNFQATGTKSARVTTNQGDRLMYAEESTQNIFSDQGTATLVNGRAVINIDPLYAQTVNLSQPYQVFVTPGSADTAGLAVINKTATSFEVAELNRGTGNFSFDWRIDALRKGYESDRMASAGPMPPDPPAPPALLNPSENPEMSPQSSDSAQNK